jgi:hypothetical protein
VGGWGRRGPVPDLRATARSEGRVHQHDGHRDGGRTAPRPPCARRPTRAWPAWRACSRPVPPRPRWSPARSGARADAGPAGVPTAARSRPCSSITRSPPTATRAPTVPRWCWGYAAGTSTTTAGTTSATTSSSTSTARSSRAVTAGSRGRTSVPRRRVGTPSPRASPTSAITPRAASRRAGCARWTG